VLKTTRGVGVAESPAYGLEWECAFPTEKNQIFLWKWSILVIFNGIRPSGSGHVQPVMTPLFCVSSPACILRVDSLDCSKRWF